MTDTTARFALPQLQPGQAQKELWHNEALALIDGCLHPAAESRGDDTPPASPTLGQAWITGTSPVGDWAGQADRLAIWTAGGWRFADPVEGMSVWLISDSVFTYRESGGWRDGVVVASSIEIGGNQVVGPQEAAIADVSGGAVIDSEGRERIDAILGALRAHGLIST